MPQLENRAGAWALAVADAIRGSVEAEAGAVAAAPAALTTLLVYPRSRIERLRHVVGLTHSGAVRLVDRLVADGLVRRRPARDRRAVALELTANGERLARKLLAVRERALEELLAPLDRDERTQLQALLDKLLTPLPADRRQLERICRLCDYWCCDGEHRECPVDRAIFGREGPARRPPT